MATDELLLWPPTPVTLAENSLVAQRERVVVVFGMAVNQLVQVLTITILY